MITLTKAFQKIFMKKIIKSMRQIIILKPTPEKKENLIGQGMAVRF